MNLSLDLTCSVPGMSFNGLRKEDVRVAGAAVKSADLGFNEIRLVLAPILGKNQAELTLAMQCDQKRIPLRYLIDLSKPRKKKAGIPIELAK